MKIKSACLALPLLLLLPACLSLKPKPDPSRFYVLGEPAKGSMERSEAEPGAKTIWVRPVVLPAYLDQIAIAERNASNEIVYRKTERWAEPLDEGVNRALFEALERRLGVGRLYAFREALNARNNQTSIDIRIEQFERDHAGEVQLVGRFRLIGKDGERAERFRWSKACAESPEAIVACMSEGVEELADQIAAAVSAAD